MPTIPLLKRNLEPAVPQVPKLDRVARPTMDVRNVLAGMSELGKASLHREVDARPFVAAAGSKGEAWGEVLKSAGDVMGDVGKTIARTGQTDTENAAGRPAKATGNADAKSGSQTEWSIGHALGGALKKGGSVLGAVAVKLGELIGVRHLHELEGDFRAERERQKAAREAAPDSTKYLVDAKRGADALREKYANVQGAPPEVKQVIDLALTKFTNDSIINAKTEQFKSAAAETDATLVGSVNAALSDGDYPKAREIEQVRLDLGTVTIEESLRNGKLLDRRQREDLLKAAPDEFKAMLEGDPGELPEFMRDIPTEEMAGYGVRIPIMQAERRRDLVKGLTTQVSAGTIAFASDIDSLLSSGKPGAEMSLPEADVAALKRKLQPELINDPVDFVSAKARVAKFDHASLGDLGAADLETDIRLKFSGGHADDLLAALGKQLKSTQGVGTLDEVGRTKAQLFGQITDDMSRGFFGEWHSRGSELYIDQKTGALMRAPFHGESGAQPVKLSEPDAAAYEKAKAVGDDALRTLTVEDQNAKVLAGRTAMALMQALDASAGRKKPHEMMEDYSAMMREPVRTMVARVLDAPPSSGFLHRHAFDRLKPV